MAEEKTQDLLNISVSPHIRKPLTVPRIMIMVLVALVPAFIASVYFFGFRALTLTAVSIITAILSEWVIVKYILKKPSTLGDYSAVVTAVLFAFNLPVDLPLWMAALGSVFAIGVAKWTFGGLGNNFINPALAGRAFLLASYPVEMTKWSATKLGSINGLNIDAVSSSTPLAAIKTQMANGTFQALDYQDSFWQLFIGNVGGTIGETSALALIIGALFLMYKHIIGIKVPLTYIGTVFLLFLVFNGTTSDILSTVAMTVATFHIFAGGLMLGALFMATDMVTSPITPLGKIIFGFGCGVLTFTIRKFGGYPEGVSYSILLMNLLVPLIDRYTRPRIYGKVAKNG